MVNGYERAKPFQKKKKKKTIREHGRKSIGVGCLRNLSIEKLPFIFRSLFPTVEEKDDAKMRSISGKHGNLISVYLKCQNVFLWGSQSNYNATTSLEYF